MDLDPQTNRKCAPFAYTYAKKGIAGTPSGFHLGLLGSIWAKTRLTNKTLDDIFEFEVQQGSAGCAARKPAERASARNLFCLFFVGFS